MSKNFVIETIPTRENALFRKFITRSQGYSFGFGESLSLIDLSIFPIKGQYINKPFFDVFELRGDFVLITGAVGDPSDPGEPSGPVSILAGFDDRLNLSDDVVHSRTYHDRVIVFTDEFTFNDTSFGMNTEDERQLNFTEAFMFTESPVDPKVSGDKKLTFTESLMFNEPT